MKENILKALECCSSSDSSCAECPFYHETEKCESLDKLAVDLFKGEEANKNSEVRKLIIAFTEELKALVRVGSEMNGNCSMCIVHDLPDVIDDLTKEFLSLNSHKYS